MQRQSGSTVLGVIIGLIVGLGIAVVVAIMITKTSLPFTNRQSQPERAADTPGSFDPNKPLYGNKEPARKANKRFANDKPPATPPENSLITDAQTPLPETTATEKVAEKVKPLDKAASKAVADAKQSGSVSKTTDSAANPPSDADEKWVYFLQAGAFRQPEDAESAKAKLALIGFEANVSERPSDTGSLYRVRVGPFKQLEVMTRARSKLSDSGVDVAVVRAARLN
jgi:cell division protein FtsN